MAQLNLQKKKMMSESNYKRLVNILVGLMASQSTIESQCLFPYDETKTYSKNMICLYQNHLYLCKSATTGVFNPNAWEMQDDVINELSLDEVKNFLSLTPEQLTTLSSIIKDDSIELSKTWSSSKSYMEIDNALKEAKQYCLTQLAKKSTGSFKIATSESEVVDGNYLYLIMNSSTSKYDIYALVDGGVEKLTTVDIDLSQYYTKDEVDNDFLKKTDADGKYATITTIDGKVDKTDILTANSSTATDEQVYSAKAINTELDKKASVEAVNDSIQSTIGELKFCNPNLLDNPFFTINQRGQTSLKCSGSDSYFVDRWNCANCVSTEFKLKDNGVNISNSVSSYSALDQTIEFLPAGEYTLSFEVVECGVGCYNIYATKIEGDKVIFEKTKVHTGTGIKTLTFTTTTDINSLRLRIFIDPPNNNTNGITIRSAKLEKGSVSTLENEEPPTYEMELLKCKLSKADINDVYSNMKACTTKVADVGKTFVPFTVPSSITVYNPDRPDLFGLYYIVKNGVCYVDVTMSLASISQMNNFTTMCSGIPRPAMSYVRNEINSWNDKTAPTLCMAINGGESTFLMAVRNMSTSPMTPSNSDGHFGYFCSFSYPVAEE